jgi:hypothetical protein
MQPTETHRKKKLDDFKQIRELGQGAFGKVILVQEITNK